MALAYAEKGWKVFPTHTRRRGKCSCAKQCSSPAKHPVTKRGLLDAATDPGTIRDWWRRWPWANVAVATGAGSGIVVLDVDVDKGGADSLTTLRTEVDIPATLTSHTGGGGLHLVFTHPGQPVKTRARAFGAGLDVRGDGGYIIAPPSTHITGNHYTWEDEATPLAPFPVLLRQQLAATRVEVPRTVVPLRRQGDRHGDGGTPYGLTALNRMVDELLATPEGARNATLNATVYAAARLIAGGELEHDPTLTVLSAAATGIGLGRVEIDRTIASATGAGMASPKTAPPRDRGQSPSVSSTKRAVPDDGWVPPDHEDGADVGPPPDAPPAAPQAIEIHDFLDADEDEYDWLIPGLLERGDRVILTGPEGGGKSTLLRQLTIQAGAGIHPFTCEQIDPVRVLYVDLENSRAHVRRQFRHVFGKLGAGGGKLERDLVYVTVEPAGIDLLYQGNIDWFTERVTEAEPELVVAGPLYKMATGDPTSEEVARKVSAVLDELRNAYTFALILEAHSPHATGGGRRPVRPYGASMWLRWPEFGIYLAEGGSLTHWRGARDEREWPTALKRGGPWPWTAVDNPRQDLMHRIVAVCEKKGHVPSERVIADTLSVSRSSVHRAIEAYPAVWAQVQKTFGEAVT